MSFWFDSMVARAGSSSCALAAWLFFSELACGERFEVLSRRAEGDRCLVNAYRSKPEAVRAAAVTVEIDIINRNPRRSVGVMVGEPLAYLSGAAGTWVGVVELWGATDHSDAAFSEC